MIEAVVAVKFSPRNSPAWWWTKIQRKYCLKNKLMDLLEYIDLNEVVDEDWEEDQVDRPPTSKDEFQMSIGHCSAKWRDKSRSKRRAKLWDKYRAKVGQIAGQIYGQLVNHFYHFK
uniref:Uncharacterized protein n=1 Tax=Romanomermis culicivorax TaxID=13658 RepID=A0A915KHZ9_ROMCU